MASKYDRIVLVVKLFLLVVIIALQSPLVQSKVSRNDNSSSIDVDDLITIQSCIPSNDRVSPSGTGSTYWTINGNNGCPKPYGKTRLFWKTTGFEADGWDEYEIILERGGQNLYSQFVKSWEDASGDSGQKGDDNVELTWTVRFKCRLQWAFHNNDCIGTFQWKLVNCGCPRERPVVVSECTGSPSNPYAAQDAVCREPNCAPGEYSNNGVCMRCASGTAKGASGPQDCTTCQPGSFALGVGNTFCTLCPPGKFQDRAKQSSCRICPAGTFSTGGARLCNNCPLPKITANAINVDYSEAGSENECGNFRSTGYWLKVKDGSVGPGGSVVEWQLTKEQSVSEGVESTEEFSQEFSVAMGQSTYFETSVAAGFTLGVQSDIIPLYAEASIEVTDSSGSEKSFEVTETATRGIAIAVSSVITTSESVACSQTCAYDANNPDRVTGFIYNWVEGLFDTESQQPVHFVRTCSTWCKYDLNPPLCPPGFCANVDCDICTVGAYANNTVDELASTAPTAPPACACARFQLLCRLRNWRMCFPFSDQHE